MVQATTTKAQAGICSIGPAAAVHCTSAASKAAEPKGIQAAEAAGEEAAQERAQAGSAEPKRRAADGYEAHMQWHWWIIGASVNSSSSGSRVGGWLR